MDAEVYDLIMSAPDPKDWVVIGCNNCNAYLAARDFVDNLTAYMDWQDLGDDGALCPDCKEETSDDD